MTESIQPMRFPQGVETPILTGLDYLSFAKNMTMDTTKSPIVVPRVNMEYNLVVDASERISGIYIVEGMRNRKRFSLIVSASGQLASSQWSNDSIDNSVNILSSMNEDPTLFKFKEISLKRRSAREIGLILSFQSVSGEYNEMTFEVTSFSSYGRLNASANASLYTSPLKQRKYGFVNSVEVKDDSAGINVDLNSVLYSSVIYCKPATPGSRPNTDGQGVCFTMAGTTDSSMGSQIFLATDNKLYYRVRNNGVYSPNWMVASNNQDYPRLISAGTQTVALNDTTPITIAVPGVDLSKARFVISATPERTSDSNGGIDIVSRSNGSFSITGKSRTGSSWLGKINWVIHEARPESEEQTFVIKKGVVQGGTFVESNSVSEGQTLRFVVESTGVVNGTNLPYNITRISQSDIGDTPLSGTVSIANGRGVVDIVIAQDFLPEDTEILRFTLAQSSTHAEINVIDVSGPPEYSCRVSRFANGSNTIVSGNEGETLYLILESKYVANGTEFTFEAADSTDLSNYVNFSAARNINNNLISIPFTLENDSNKPYEGTETLTLRVLKSGAVVTSTNITVVDTAWAAECWYSSSATGSNQITHADEGSTVYFCLRVPSSATLNTFFKPAIKNVGTGYALEGVDVDVTNASMTAKEFIGPIVLTQKIVISADRRTEGDEMFYMEWVNQSTSQVVADSNKALLIKDTSLTPVQNLYWNSVNLKDVDLKTIFETQFGAQDVPWICNLYVTGQSWVSSTSTSKAAITCDNWMAGTVINIFWDGTGGVIGKGGIGANPKNSTAAGVGGPAFNVGSGFTLNVNVASTDIIVASGGGGGGGVSISGVSVGGGGGAADGLGGAADHPGSAASRLNPGSGGSYDQVIVTPNGDGTNTTTTTTFVGGVGGAPGLAGSTPTTNGANTPGATFGSIKTGSGALILKKNGVAVNTSTYYNANSYIRGGW